MRIFVTVGNALVPFDRLLQWTDLSLSGLSEAASWEGVCQHGPSRVRPARLAAKAHLTRFEFEHEMAAADVVVCHGGVGTLQEAMRQGHRPLVVARRAMFGEIVNDHQLEIASALGETGRIELIHDAEGLRAALFRYAHGEARRGPAEELRPERLLPVAEALSLGPFRPKPNPLGALLVRGFAALAPPLERLRVS